MGFSLVFLALAASCGGGGDLRAYRDTGRTADLIPVKDAESGLWGYLDAKGKTAIGPKFAKAHYFLDGKANVQDTSGLFGFISPDGKYVIQPRYASASDFNCGLAWVAEPDSALVAIDSKGARVFGLPKATEVSVFIGGYALFKASDGKVGIVDSKGKIIPVPLECSDAFIGDDGIVCFYGKDFTGCKVGRIRNGAVELLAGNLEMDIVDASSEFGMLIIRLEDKFGLADFEGRIVVNPRYRSLRFDSEGMILFSNEKEKYGWIDTRGEEVIKARYKEVGDLFALNGYATVSTTGSKFQIINRKGETMFGAKFPKLAATWTPGVFRARDDEGWGLIKTDGTEICAPQFDGLSCVREGLFMASPDKTKWGVISESGVYEGSMAYATPYPGVYFSSKAYSCFFDLDVIAGDVEKLKSKADYSDSFGDLAIKFLLSKSSLAYSGNTVDLQQRSLSRLGVNLTLSVVLDRPPLVYANRFSSKIVFNKSARPLSYYIVVACDTPEKSAALYDDFRARFGCESNAGSRNEIESADMFVLHIPAEGKCVLEPMNIGDDEGPMDDLDYVPGDEE